MTTSAEKPTEKIQVAIIGAGASGLVMGHQLMTDSRRFSVTLFEQTPSIGGTWVYTERIGLDQYGLPVHSSMYKNLRTNLPKELMAFLDFPFSSEGPSYVHRESVISYLNDYCDHFDIRRHVKFFSRVIKVTPKNDKDNKQWLIETEDVITKKQNSHTFDAVVVCNGHYAVPRYPEIKDLKNFKGKVMHSHDYRVPEPFSGQNVLCIGAGSSGVDIALEIAELANQVVLSHDLPNCLLSPFPENVKEMTWIASCQPHGFTFQNGDFFRADTLIVCTGYEYSFPFLSPDCGISIEEHRVTNLYKHLININYPSMAILSIPFTTVPFVVSDIQAQFVKEIFSNPSLLPAKDEMHLDTQKELCQKSKLGGPSRHFHKFVYKIWDYLNELTQMTNLKSVPPSREKLYKLAFDNRMLNFCTFRELNYRATEAEVFYR